MKFWLILFLALTISCEKDSAKEYAKILANEECNLVVEVPPTNSVWFKVKGYHPETKEEIICKTHNRWWNMFADEIEVGDTIIKKKGELIFSIHKKDTLINHKW
ncbi:hypothetical protein [Chryseobacterium sp. 2R14A]|uniref:hypothetical protein n=1 Tax=Chryseobacterium sp. 2R14A TaxID=3380353 RepID=UPI003CECC29D